MSLGDGEIHVIAIGGAAVLSLAMCLPMVYVSGCGDAVASADDKVEKVVIEASLAMRKTPKKQPQKEFRQPDAPEKPVGVSRDDKKVLENQCCTDEADCNVAGLAVGTTCPEGSSCTNHRCIKKREKTNPDDKDPIAAIPDRNKNKDNPTGKPTDNTVGEFDGSLKGTAKKSSGDPWLRELANDFTTLVDFPSLEAASSALACLRILEDGTIKETTLNPPTGQRSDNEGLNAKIENAFKQIKDKRKEKPQAVPTHLLKQVVTKWTCIPIDAQAKQD